MLDHNRAGGVTPVSGETNNNPSPEKKKKVRKNDMPFEVRIKYVDHPLYEKTMREPPPGYLAT